MSLPVPRVRHQGIIGGHDGDVLVCASFGPAGEVVAVWTTVEGLGGLIPEPTVVGRCQVAVDWGPVRRVIFCCRVARAACGLSTAYRSSNFSPGEARRASHTRTSGMAPPW
jgi:hypothetical protein